MTGLPVAMAAPWEGGENKSANCWEGRREGEEALPTWVAGLAIFSQEPFLALPFPQADFSPGQAAGKKGVKSLMLMFASPLSLDPYSRHLLENSSCQKTAQPVIGFGYIHP